MSTSLNISSSEENRIRPFFIGIVDSGLSNNIIKLLEQNLQGYPISTISMITYLKEDESKKDSGKNKCFNPNEMNFDKLISDLDKICNKEECESQTKEMAKKTIKSQIIIVEGLLCFSDPKVRDFMDLKIFIDTDNDIRLARTIINEIANGKSLKEIKDMFIQDIKPKYNQYILPTKKYADVILPNSTGHETAVKIITNYLKILFDKILNNKTGSIFSFLNEVVDPKYVFIKDNLKVLNEKDKTSIEFLKDVFEEFINNNQDEEFIELVRQKLMEEIQTLLENHLKEKFINNQAPHIDYVIFDSDKVEDIIFQKEKIIVFFKTSIMNNKDVEIPEKILQNAKDCNFIICSVFLAPKNVYYLNHKGIHSLTYITLYFSEFFGKYEELIKKDETIYNEKELDKKFKALISEINA